MLTSYWKQFIECHAGLINKILHVIGFVCVGIGIMEKDLVCVIAGIIIQEIGHLYQYANTGKFEHSPFYCTKSQLIFAYPLFILIILYVVLAKQPGPTPQQQENLGNSGSHESCDRFVTRVASTSV